MVKDDLILQYIGDDLVAECRKAFGLVFFYFQLVHQIGKSLRERVFCDEKACYKFTGKELDNENALEWYYFGATDRNFDFPCIAIKRGKSA